MEFSWNIQILGSVFLLSSLRTVPNELPRGFLRFPMVFRDFPTFFQGLSDVGVMG
jgi:hypothetical protein